MYAASHQPVRRRCRPWRVDGPRPRGTRTPVRLTTTLLTVTLLGAGLLVTPPAESASDLRLVALDRAELGGRTVTLVGIVPSDVCAPEAVRAVSLTLEGRLGRFIAVPEGSDRGVVVLDDGRTVNELVLGSGCPRFDATGLPADNPYIKNLEIAARRHQAAATAASAPPGAAPPPPASTAGPAAMAAAAAGNWRIVTKWTGSTDQTTDPIALPAGEVRIVTLAVPNGGPDARIAVVVRDDTGRILQAIEAGPLAAKHMGTTPLRLERDTRVQLSISGTNVFWGVWAQIPR